MQKKLLEEIKRGQQFDLLLIDVIMPGLDGMELARVLRNEREITSIVFISNNREMALQGYEVSAARYLSKPLQKERLKEAVVFCYGHRQEDKELLISANGVMRKVRASHICYLEIYGRKTRIRLEDETWDINLSLDELEQMLSGRGFIRCHKSFLVNCRYIRTFSSSSIELADGKEIPVSKHRIKDVRKAFFDYMNR
ncbi:MAG: LytTR family DNA-binding domain-containing protein [Eubacteriales bacterium]|nr:LytTR family DNA-binding domain-containing protein [Eubacteriales bacterium]